MIAIASDHGGFLLKQHLLHYLTEKGYSVSDCGTHDESSCDYPDYAKVACRLVQDKQANCAILICGTGVGMSMAANKQQGIRAALCSEALTASLTRKHNDANVLCMGGRMIGFTMAEEIATVFLTTEFSDEPRHIHRIQSF